MSEMPDEGQSRVFVHEAGNWRRVLTHLSSLP